MSMCAHFHIGTVFFRYFQVVKYAFFLAFVRPDGSLIALYTAAHTENYSAKHRSPFATRCDVSHTSHPRPLTRRKQRNVTRRHCRGHQAKSRVLPGQSPSLGAEGTQRATLQS